MKRNADWPAWTLQFILGFIVGALLGFVLVSKGRRLATSDRGWWLAADQVPLFILGAALIGAALASFYGDQLWIGSHRLLTTEDMQHNRMSRMTSLATGALGVLLVLTAIIRHFQTT